MKPFGDYDRNIDGQLFGASIERLRNNDRHNEIHMDELRANLDDGLRMPEATPKVIPGNSGNHTLIYYLVLRFYK